MANWIIRKMMVEKVLCPVCGRFEFEEKRSYEICPYCGWENDGYTEAGGANDISLADYKTKYMDIISKNPSYMWDDEVEADEDKKFMNERLEAQLAFTAEIDKMTSVMRRTLLLDRSRRENDAEHSWHISVMALLFEEYAIEKPNVNHAIEMALCHDLVEVYAGDTFAYDVAGNESKKQRELDAADKLFSMLPSEQGEKINALWQEFEAKETADSKYANCLDRIQPFLHNTLTEGHTWKNVDPRPRRYQIEERMSIVKEFMPEVYSWMLTKMDEAVVNGWLLE